MAGSTTSTLLVNKTEKEISFFVESSGGNYRFKKTLKAHETSKEEFDPNSTFSTLRMFHNKAPTDISVSTDDMIESRVITITEPEPGCFLLTASAQSGETKTKPAGSSKSIWNLFGWLPFRRISEESGNSDEEASKH